MVCPWHYWKYHCRTGDGEPGYEADGVPAHKLRVEGGRVLVQQKAASKRTFKPHAPHPLARKPQRIDGPVRVLGISTTTMTAGQPRYSTSEDLLEASLRHAKDIKVCERGADEPGWAQGTRAGYPRAAVDRAAAGRR